MLRRNMLDSILWWIPAAVIIVCLSGIVAFVAQQHLRLGANALPRQLAGDGAAALAGGAAPEAVVPAGTIDIATSLSPFVMVFDDTGAALASSARLRGQVPAPPGGVFDFTRQRGEDRITWQPEPGVRIAAVILRVAGPRPGFVLAGQSLRETERLIDQLQFDALALGIVTLFGSFVAVVAVVFVRRWLRVAG